MSSLWQSVLGFGFCALVIVLSGARLVRYGDIIAELTGVGRVWIGMVLMAAVTSLPELMAGISAVTVVGSPDLAAGNVLGSCMFNLLILSFIDVRISRPITSLVRSGHIFSGLFGIVMIAIVGAAVVYGDSVPSLLWLSPFSPLLIVVYLFAVRVVYKRESSPTYSRVPVEIEGRERNLMLKDAIHQYIFNGLVVVIAASFLPYFGDHLAGHMGLNETFFGTLFLAVSTSLPEIVVSFAAIRTGSYDLLMGNLLGSNLFNIFVLAVGDIFYLPGSLYANMTQEHMQSVMIVIVMTAVVGLGLLVQPSRKIWRLGLDTLIVLLLYIGLMVSLFMGS